MAMARNRERQEKLAKKARDDAKVNYTVTKPGDAVNFPRKGDTVAIHYTAHLEDGTQIDDSYARSQPIYFVLGGASGVSQVIPGFEQVIPIMSRGEKARLVIPPDMAYGDLGYPPIIPPNSHITYEIELLSFSSIGTTKEHL